jgi:hypothetical protein
VRANECPPLFAVLAGTSAVPGSWVVVPCAGPARIKREADRGSYLPATVRPSSRPRDRHRGGHVTRREKCALFFLFAFPRIRKDGEHCIFSHKIKFWHETIDERLSQYQIPGHYVLSLHYFSWDDFDYILLKDRTIIQPDSCSRCRALSAESRRDWVLH